jgi:hypothetical protein
MEQRALVMNGQPTSFLDFYPIGFAGIQTILSII